MALKGQSRDPRGSLRLFQGICKVKTTFLVIYYLPLFYAHSLKSAEFSRGYIHVISSLWQLTECMCFTAANNRHKPPTQSSFGEWKGI